MAEITKASLTQYGVDSFTPVELTGTDTLASTAKQGTLFIYNTTAGSVNVVIDGDGGATVDTPTAGPVDVSGGFTAACAVDEITKVNLGNIAGYLSGDVDVTGGASGVFAWVL